MMRRCVITFCALLVLLLAWYLFRAPDPVHEVPVVDSQQTAVKAVSGSSSGTVYKQPELSEDAVRDFNLAFATPITFYGKVVDQFGVSIPQAMVRLAATDSPLGKSSKYDRTTDASGLFSIRGIHGMSLLVEVDKPGFRRLPERGGVRGWNGVFRYAVPTVDGLHVPDANNPVVFVLYRPGVAEPLIKTSGSEDVARNGTPTTIDLNPKASGSAHQLVVMCVNHEQQKAADAHQYDWRLEVKAPRGALVLRTDPSVFTAPEDGYQPSVKVEMPASLPIGKWRDNAKLSLFVRFDDDVVARVELDMIAGGDHFVDWKAWLNPKPGSRILEPGAK